jgi:mannose-6-phosphate isomerase-like protein (cupin superfamily)
MKLIAAALLSAAFALPAGDPAGFSIWKAAELKGYAKTLAPKMSEKKIASQVIANYGNYAFQMAHREGSGEGEWHEKMADVFFVQSGEATLIYGGELVDGKTTAPGEMRSAAIRGGMEKKVAAGDVVTIPAKAAHQMKLDPGKEITYFVVKIAQ